MFDYLSCAARAPGYHADAVLSKVSYLWSRCIASRFTLYAHDKAAEKRKEKMLDEVQIQVLIKWVVEEEKAGCFHIS